MEFTINKLATTPFSEGMSNIVKGIHWTAVEGVKQVSGYTKLSPPKEIFTPFESLQESTVKNWLVNTVDLGRVERALLKSSVGLDTPWSEGFSYEEPEEVRLEREWYEYNKAVTRLERYVLAEGLPELWEKMPTGEEVMSEETGEMEPVTVDTLVRNSIEPLPATVEITNYDEEGNASTETAPNPEIVSDNTERAEAQAIVDKGEPK
ncbi:MAG: hypothetical protein HOE44_13960 [Candidatus Marinimicrobia bacterium]|nr:hypothetical protein [Candidatus Neomarinimicrobiota bacterium]